VGGERLMGKKSRKRGERGVEEGGEGKRRAGDDYKVEEGRGARSDRGGVGM